MAFPRRLPSEDRWLSDWLILSLMLLIFYTLWLGSYPLFTPDEGRYSEVAREMVVSYDYITPRVNGVPFLDKPILYYWLQTIAIHLFGIKEWALRLFPILSAILGCLITYTCGRHLFNRKTGWLSAIILATAPLYFGNAHYANLDLEVAVFISCSLLLFITALQKEEKSRSYFLYAYFFAALAFLTKGLIGIVFPAIIISAWMLFTKRLKSLSKIHLIKGSLLFLLLVLPWYFLVQKANPNFLHYFFMTQHVTRFLSTNTFNNPTPVWFYVPIVLIGFFPWTIFLFQALKQSAKHIRAKSFTYQTELFLLTWIAFIFIFFSIPHSKIIGYILPIFPALSLLIGHYLATIWDEAQKKNRLSIAIYIGMGLAIAIISLLLPYYQWIELSKNFNIHLIAMVSILIASTIAMLFLLQKKTMLALFMTCAISSSLFLLALVSGATHLNRNSTKLLVEDLKTIIQPQDEVISYFKFYQDVPIYLGKCITIVANWQDSNIPHKDNWIRELWYGMSFQKTDWLINEDEFWKRWHAADKRVFVFLNDNYFNQFKSSANRYFYLGKNNDVILLSNKPTILALRKA